MSSQKWPCVHKAILEKNFPQFQVNLILIKMVWLIHKGEGNKDFQNSLLHEIQFWQLNPQET